MKKTIAAINFVMQKKDLKYSDLDNYLKQKQSSIMPMDIENILDGNGRINKDMLYNICEFMDVPITFIFVLSEDPKNIPVYKRWIFKIIKRIVLFLI